VLIDWFVPSTSSTNEISILYFSSTDCPISDLKPDDLETLFKIWTSINSSYRKERKKCTLLRIKPSSCWDAWIFDTKDFCSWNRIETWRSALFLEWFLAYWTSDKRIQHKNLKKKYHFWKNYIWSMWESKRTGTCFLTAEIRRSRGSSQLLTNESAYRTVSWAIEFRCNR